MAQQVTQVIVPNNYPIYQIFEVSNVYCSVSARSCSWYHRPWAVVS